ncbi:hypothetical protein OCK74_21940 [Chitinophagaceae bacterium LB-8]|uniref:Uncharacterized protein n=1 Tax=Paraflavisolibacter caeni TaxID=2982496 RepID=A0A9X3BJY1_9BACT|nr:hypothetical protein [Paraflavisolibacter caeni]MCU7551798.1 hypothetical protein [Paraflavisolibacter caeni]
MKVNSQNATRWSANWAGRGTALLDSVERHSEKMYQTSIPSRRTLSVEDKLKQLIKKYPKKRFYQSLLWQMEKYPLSKKQADLVEMDYWRYFKKY